MLSRQVLRHVAGVQTRAFAGAAKFNRDLIHMNIGTIGHVDHGKTTTTAALSKITAELYPDVNDAGKVKNYADIDSAPEEKMRGITINQSHTEYSSSKRHYGHVDCPGHADYVKNMITGAAQMDGAILVCAGDSGPMPQTREHILLAKQVGVPKLVCWLNKLDCVTDTEMLELVELELREMLDFYGFDGDDVPFVYGSALKAIEGDTTTKVNVGGEDHLVGVDSIRRLIETCDSYLPDPERAVDKPFIMSIEGVLNVPKIGTVATGKIEAGKIKKGDKIEAVGMKEEIDGKASKFAGQVGGLEMFHKQLDAGQAGDQCGMMLKGLKGDNLKRGMCIINPKEQKNAPCKLTKGPFKADIYVMKTEEGGREKPFMNSYRPQAYFRTAQVTVGMKLPDGVEMAMPGDRTSVTVTSDKFVYVEKGMRFAMREGGKTVGSGVITEMP